MRLFHQSINQYIMKIVLLGYMGSGKSTLAKALALVYNQPSIDLDEYIEEKEGLGVPDIFKQSGEIYFRKMESRYLLELLNDEDHFVLSLGGGTPCYGNNMALVEQKALSFYLKGSIDTLFNRLQSAKQSRPLIASLNDEQLKEFIAKHLFERRRFYERADRILSIDGKNTEEIAREVVKQLAQDHSR